MEDLARDVGGHGHATHVGVGSNDWKVAHRELVRLARLRAGQDFDEGAWLLTALRSGAHRQLGYGSFAEYIERLFGYAPRLTQEKLRLAEALETLPEMAQSLRDGKASWSALRELTRVATPETEHEWLAVSQGRTVREVERLVSGHRPGTSPRDPVDRGAVRHVLRFEVSGDALAMFREALTKIQREAGGHLDDNAALLLMARQVLGGPTDEGRASYQVALTVCEACREGFMQGAGDSVRVGPDVMEMAVCDAQHVGPVAAQPNVRQSASGRASPHVGATRARAAQEIPPAVRRLVLRRDSHRCVVPGCRHTTFVDVHHIQLRAECGSHEPENLVTMCSAHHRGIHEGRLVVEGSASALRVRHADGTSYGRPVIPGEIDTNTRAFAALRKLGFGEGEARRALDRVRATGAREGARLGAEVATFGSAPRQVHLADSVERVIRAALHELTRTQLARVS